MRRIVAALVVVVLAGASGGCGGGGGGGGYAAAPAPVATATGTFVDSPVEGIEYVSGKQKGVTGAGGTFTYEVGAPVTFSIGGIVLGTTTGKKFVTPADLVAGGSADTPQVQDISRLLMTLDSDSDPTNGILIDPQILTAAKGMANLPWTTLTDQDMITALGTMGCPYALVTRDAARTALMANILSLYVGNWSGTGTVGTTTFSLLLPVAADGTITGDVTIGGQVLAVDGFVLTDSTFTATDVDGTTYTGTMNPSTRTFTGTVTTGAGTTGTFTGTMI